jgi:clan AA aspartic protease
MGHVFADIKLINPKRSDLDPIEVRALADTGSLMMCIPEHIALQLGLETQSEREVTVADRRKRKVSYVGPLQVAFDRRMCFVGALVLGDEVLLGAVAMEDMDLVVIPSSREVRVNPENPNFAHSRVK